MATTIRPAVVIAQEGGGRKIRDGIYTEAQAARGKPAFETSSLTSPQQASGLYSERAPALKGDGFLTHWETRPPRQAVHGDSRHDAGGRDRKRD